MMKIALLGSFGGGTIPDFIKVEGEKHWRVSLAEEILKLEETENPRKIFDKLENNEINYIRHKNIVYFKDKNYNFIFTVRVEEVDTSKKWRIKDNGGLESIEYIKELILIDKQLNLYE